MKPIVIDIEGLIGAGKSSIIKECLLPMWQEKGYRVTIIPEPVDEWGDILPLFYNDPARWAYHFQTIAFHDRVRVSQRVWKEKYFETDIFITERGVISDKIFMNTLHKQKHVSDMEMKHYLKWWNMWTEVMPFKPDAYIYLSPSIEEVMQRVKIRNREGEEGISLEYQLLLKEQHDKIFCAESDTIDNMPVCILETDENFKICETAKKNIISCIENKLEFFKK